MKKILCLLTVCLLMLTGCGGNADFAIRVADETVSANDYYRTVASQRSNYLAVEEAEDSVEFWKEKQTDGSTHSQLFTETVNDYLIERKLYTAQFNKLGLSLSETAEETIRTSLSQAVEAAGGRSNFDSELASMNYTYDEYVDEVYDSARKRAVLDHYFGENGTDPVSEKDIKDYYNVHNALVKVVYVLKVDPESGAALDTDSLNAAKAKADDAYAAATRPSDTDLFEDVIDIFSAYPNDKNGVVISDKTYEENIYSVALDLEVGEVGFLDTESFYMVIKRYDGTADDVFTVSMKYATLETVREEEIEELLAQWKKDFKIKINKKVTKQYAPEKLVSA